MTRAPGSDRDHLLRYLESMVRADWPPRAGPPIAIEGTGITIDRLALRIVDIAVVAAEAPLERVAIIVIDAPDRTDGEPARITFRTRIQWPEDERARARELRAALLGVLGHELDESIRACGALVLDPHTAAESQEP